MGCIEVPPPDITLKEGAVTPRQLPEVDGGASLEKRVSEDGGHDIRRYIVSPSMNWSGPEGELLFPSGDNGVSEPELTCVWTQCIKTLVVDRESLWGLYNDGMQFFIRDIWVVE